MLLRLPHSLLSLYTPASCLGSSGSTVYAGSDILLLQDSSSCLTWKFFSSACSAFQLDLLTWTSHPPKARMTQCHGWHPPVEASKLRPGCRSLPCVTLLRALGVAVQGGKVHNLVVQLNGGIIHAATAQQSVRKQSAQLEATVPEESPCRELHGYSFTITVCLRPCPRYGCMLDGTMH